MKPLAIENVPFPTSVIVFRISNTVGQKELESTRHRFSLCKSIGPTPTPTGSRRSGVSLQLVRPNCCFEHFAPLGPPHGRRQGRRRRGLQERCHQVEG